MLVPTFAHRYVSTVHKYILFNKSQSSEVCQKHCWPLNKLSERMSSRFLSSPRAANAIIFILFISQRSFPLDISIFICVSISGHISCYYLCVKSKKDRQNRKLWDVLPLRTCWRWSVLLLKLPRKQKEITKNTQFYCCGFRNYGHWLLLVNKCWKFMKFNHFRI